MTIENVQPPRTVKQPRVVDVSRPGQALTVEIEASEAAELLLSLATLLVEDEQDTYELGAARIDELRAATPPELLRQAAELLPEKSAALLLGLVYTTPKPRTASAFLEHLARDRPDRDPPPPARLLPPRSPRDRAGDDPTRGGRRCRGDRRVAGRSRRVRRSGQVRGHGAGRPHGSGRRQASRSSTSSRAGPSTSCPGWRRRTRRSPSVTQRQSASS